MWSTRGSYRVEKIMYISNVQTNEEPPSLIGSNDKYKDKEGDNNENKEEYSCITVEPRHPPTPQNDDQSRVTAPSETESTDFNKILSREINLNFTNVKILDNKWLRWGECTFETYQENLQEVENTWV